VSSPIIEATPADTDVVLSFGKIISTSLSMTLEQNVIALGRALENNGSVDILVTTMNICGSRRAFPRRLYRRRALIESLFSSVKRKLSARAPGRSLRVQMRQALLLGLSFNLYRLKHRRLFQRMSTELKTITRRLLVFLFLPCSLWGQSAHPRIWLDSDTLTHLRHMVAAKDRTWIAMKADADAYVRDTVPAYNKSACGRNQICYTYDGSGWLDALEKLSLAYKLTGKTSYSNQVKAILNAMVAVGVAPERVNSGYPSRNIVLGLALAYDWCYDQLSSTDKTNYSNLLDTWWMWVQAHGYQWNCAGGECPNGYGNYFGGHLLGFGLAALAVEGDDANSAAMQAVILNNFNTYVVPAFGSGGGFQGGYAVESYNYGGSHFLRLLGYMWGMTTAGKTDLLNNNIAWVKTIATNTLYEERPDLWSITDEGGWTGSYPRVMYRNFPLELSKFLNGLTEGGWMQYLYNHMVTPTSGAPASLYAPSTFESFLYNTGQTAVDYTASQPLYHFSPGDGHTLVRTDWTTSAVHTTFSGSSKMNYADHESHSAGHISVQRGLDYLLVNAGEWAGPTGNVGGPQADDIPNWHKNTLFYWDQGTDCLSQTGSGGQYAGCQMFWSTANSVNHAETAGYVFQEAPLQNAYLNNRGLETLTGYTRSFVNIDGDVDFVFDRITAPATSQRTLEWHTPALRSALVPGNATAINVSGNIASATVGRSTIWIDTLLPLSPLISKVTDVQNWTVTTQMGTQRFEVSDPNASSCSTNCLFLTVLASTPSRISSMPFTKLISTSNYKGAIYNDGTLARIALFSADGTSQTGVNYEANYSASLTGRHVISDLVPGTYDVSRGGTTLYSSLVVGGDGTLSFTSTGGSVYAVRLIH